MMSLQRSSRSLKTTLCSAGQVVSVLETMGPEATEAVRVYVAEIFDHVANGGGFVRLKEAGGATFFVPIETRRNLESLGGLATPFLRSGLNDEHEAVRVVSAYVLVDQNEDSAEGC